MKRTTFLAERLLHHRPRFQLLRAYHLEVGNQVPSATLLAPGREGFAAHELPQLNEDRQQRSMRPGEQLRIPRLAFVQPFEAIEVGFAMAQRLTGQAAPGNLFQFADLGQHVLTPRIASVPTASACAPRRPQSR